MNCLAKHSVQEKSFYKVRLSAAQIMQEVLNSSKHLEQVELHFKHDFLQLTRDCIFTENSSVSYFKHK